MRAIRLLVVVAVLGSGAAGADEAPSSPPTRPPTFAAGAPLEEVLQGLRDAAGLPLGWDPQDKAVRGKVLMAPVTFAGDASAALAHLRAVLLPHDLVVVTMGGEGREIHTVVDARQTSGILRLKARPVEVTDENAAAFAAMDGLFVSATIRAPHLSDLTNLRNALQRLVTSQNIGSVTEVPDARAFVVTDFAPNVAAVHRIVRRMDEEAARAAAAEETRRIPLQHLAASEAAEFLSRGGAPSPMPPRAAGTPTPPGGPGVPRISVDSRTNSLLVRGEPEAVAAIQRAVTALDVPRSPSLAEDRVLRVTGVDVEETALAVLAFIAASAADWPDRPAVVAHAGSSCLLLNGRAASLDRIERLVRRMEEAAAAPRAVTADGPEEAIRKTLETRRVSLDLDDIPLAEVLKSLARSAGVNLIVSPAVNASEGAAASVTFQATDLPVARVLDLILAPMGYQWRIEGQVVLIRDAQGR